MRRWVAAVVVGAAALAFAGRAGAVIGGSPVAAGDPAAAGLVMLSGPNGFCSGAALSPTLVLTAAHCVEGAPRLAALVFDAQRRPVLNEVIAREIHPEYRAADWRARRTAIDLAILRTSRPISGVGTASLSGAPLPAAGARLRLLGFGPLAEGDARSAGVLRSTVLTVTGRPSTYQVRLIGPDGGALGACVGDSGGPALAGSAIVGVVSWTTGAAGARCGRMTGLTPVGPHRAWIDAAMRRLGN